MLEKWAVFKLRRSEQITYGWLVEELRDEGWLLCDWLGVLRADSAELSATTAL